jgi:hypothetical protein
VDASGIGDSLDQPQTKACPGCGREILAKALKCRHCGVWIRDDEPAATEETVAQAPSFERSTAYSDRQPVTHLVLLSILTFGLYQLYWFSRTWKSLRELAGVDVSPGWRTAGLCVPFVNIAMIYHHFRLVRDVTHAAGVSAEYSPGLLTATYFGFVLLSNTSVDAWMLSLLTIVAVVPVHTTLNRYWEKLEPGRPMRVDFNGPELAMMIAGGLLMVMAISATFIPS